MALVTVQRSPCGTNSPGPSTDESDGPDTQDEESTDKKGISECYFAVKGAALVLPHDECLHLHRKNIANGACDIQQHLQSMLYLLHADDILKMAVKLESAHGSRTRYLVVVYHGGGAYQTEESCLLGVDCNRETTIGLLLPVWADTKITLDGDGGFSVTSSGRHHIFKPVSVQAMWSALQTLHKASSKAREYNYFKCGGTHQWVDYYESRIGSDRSCLNEWHAMDDIESRRPPSPDTVRVQPTEREETERHIRTKLKELMMSVDLDEVTSKYIRTRLEEILDMNLKEYKSFIDQEMLTILGQMDSPTEIFQYLYLGSEWNASNLEELVVNGISHILNVTREIDNFFPGMFDYQNIRVYDDESTEILHYWDKTYRYIRRAKDEGSKVLVHCKMGISRSASVVIAYVMKAYDWDLQRALEFVKTKRGCIKPNSGFLKQLEIYQGILDASKQRHNSLWRSKSETNLKSSKPKKKEDDSKKQKVPEKSESLHHLTVSCGASLRPKSWSPSRAVADMLFPSHHRHSARICDTEKGMDQEAGMTFTSLNLESTSYFNGIPPYSNKERDADCLSADIPSNPSLSRVSSIKDRINELELQVTSTSDKALKTEIKSPTSQSRSGLVFNLANHFESASKPSSPVDEGLVMKAALEEAIVQPVISQTKPPVCKHHAVLVKPSLWPTETSESVTLGKTSPKVMLTGNNSCDNSGQKPSFDGPKTSHSAFKPLNPQSRGSLDQKQGPFSHSCPISEKKTLPLIVGKNNPLANKEFSKMEAMSPSSPDQKPGQSGSSEKKSLPLILGKNNPLANKEFSKILEPTSPIKSPDLKAGQSEKKSLPVIKTSNPLANKEFSKILEPISPIKNPFKYLDTTLVPATDSANLCEVLKVNYFYDKEDIPFTPGKVQRTRQKIEEKNLTRTMSFDSGFPFQSQSMPSTPPEGESATSVKVIRRSHSLRNDCRPFCGKWYPLPALASNAPVTFRRASQSFQGARNVNLSISTPSVVEAVNRVICGTQEVLSSAIPFMPSKKASSGSSDSDFDFGSATSLPEIDSMEPQQRESPVPGLVKLQRDILESRGLKLDQDSPLVIADDIKESGIVKRLKKELEAKSTTKGERGAGLPEAENTLNSANKDYSKESCSETPSSLARKSTFDKAPPTPHRKTSLDLSCFMQRRFPLNIRLGSQPNIKPNTARTTFGSPPDLARTAEIPPAGLTRKLRKQQGSSHPLSKLIKQRHPNPLYNTM